MTLDRTARLWVIEMLGDDDLWEPTVGCGITLDDARREVLRWRENNPDDKFRVKEYVRYA